MMFNNSNIFIDGGGNDYNRAKRYINKIGNFDKIYVFEPNPVFHEAYKNSGFTLMKKAIWVEDKIKPFYVSKDENHVASSVLEEKLCKVNNKIMAYFYDNPLNVECIDFSKWIKDNIKPYDNLTLKLDIEGAEYEVLWKMLKDDTLKYVKKLYVEFHKDTVLSKEKEHDKLIKSIEDTGMKIHYWD